MENWFQCIGPNIVINQASKDSNIYDPTNGTISDGDIEHFHPYGFCSAGFYTEGSDKGF